MSTCAATWDGGKCDRPTRTHSADLCGAHYQQRRRGQTLHPLDGRVRRPARNCTQPGCTGKHYSLGWCQLHYQRRRDGTPMDAPKWVYTPTECAVDGCTDAAICKGFCNPHYQRHNRTGHPERDGRTQTRAPVAPPRAPMPRTVKQAAKKRQMPPGWDRTEKATPATKRLKAGPGHVKELPPFAPLPASILARSRLGICDRGGADLLDMLGLTDAELREAALRDRLAVA